MSLCYITNGKAVINWFVNDRSHAFLCQWRNNVKTKILPLQMAINPMIRSPDVSALIPL